MTRGGAEAPITVWAALLSPRKLGCTVTPTPQGPTSLGPATQRPQFPLGREAAGEVAEQRRTAPREGPRPLLSWPPTPAGAGGGGDGEGLRNGRRGGRGGPGQPMGAAPQE